VRILHASQSLLSVAHRLLDLTVIVLCGYWLNQIEGSPTKRDEFDLEYIEHWSVWLDIKIILLTLFKGFLNKNAF
jgi:hypothetical protein